MLIEQLDNIQDTHHKSFLIAYPDARLKNKSHYKKHFGKNIKRFGPLDGVNTTRYEGKHSFGKDLLSNTNYHNDAKTLLIRSIILNLGRYKQERSPMDKCGNSFRHTNTSGTANIRTAASTKTASIYVQKSCIRCRYNHTGINGTGFRSDI